ncbi:MAG: 3'(2'),5'-bisphosphate nucleotidase CysQ [Rhodobiaceae bacterium]|nr:3'(2'),5'-bisphosphate nucleotidase CysQ [Rhodobiaceae bacterium]MCC0053368.1 3'(2'),5'-bisphosphate nucleotidase CysQ [Rhodobiaceae bacterium]
MVRPPPFSQHPGTGTVLAIIAASAGRAILDVYARVLQVDYKDDRSPVTEADRLAEAIIIEQLAQRFTFPTVPVVAEEAVSAGAIPAHEGLLFLVDPLDGTREFIARRGEFTVNIALVEDHRPVAGVVYAPAFPGNEGWMFFADDNGGAFETNIVDPAGRAILPPRDQWTRIGVRKPPLGGLTAVASRSHLSHETEQYLERLNVGECTNIGSSLKFCLLARGDADVYPRLSPTMEWDTAAGDAVLRAAGGCVVDLDGNPLRYGAAPGEYTNPSFVAWGRANPPRKSSMN